jgi:outer membrane protein assembly factor BamE
MKVSLWPAGGLPSQEQPVQSSDHIVTLHTMFEFQRRRASLILLLAASLSLVACGSLNGASKSIAGVITPYKMDIVQGNFVSKEQAAALKPGMNREQVRNILGTPLLTSIFHAERWDYVFTFKRQGLEPQARRVTVFFKGDVLERIEADALPTEAEFVASLDSGRNSGKVPVLEMTPESLTQLPVPTPAKVTVPKTLPPLPASYPPLEPAGR